MSVSRLTLYNDALTVCGERTLSSLTENREPRRVLDQVWNSGAVDYCLEQGLWNFAVRSIKFEYSPSVEPPWGYRRAFDKPTDYIRTAAVCSDEYFQQPLLRYVDEATFWFADLDALYIRYVSNADDYGNNLGGWTGTFAEYVSNYLASKAVRKLSQDKEKRDQIDRETRKSLIDAKSKDAMNEPTAFAPRGSWTSARMGNRVGTRDRGYRGGNLVG